VCLYGIFISGVTLDDQKLVDGALYGLGAARLTPLEASWTASIQVPKRGPVVGCGCKSGGRGRSLTVMIAVAEVMWHRGVDLYGYQNMALKNPSTLGCNSCLAPIPSRSTRICQAHRHAKHR